VFDCGARRGRGVRGGLAVDAEVNPPTRTGGYVRRDRVSEFRCAKGIACKQGSYIRPSLNVQLRTSNAELPILRTSNIQVGMFGQGGVQWQSLLECRAGMPDLRLTRRSTLQAVAKDRSPIRIVSAESEAKDTGRLPGRTHRNGPAVISVMLCRSARPNEEPPYVSSIPRTPASGRATARSQPL
jgi:hypothetical protein